MYNENYPNDFHQDTDQQGAGQNQTGAAEDQSNAAGQQAAGQGGWQNEGRSGYQNTDQGGWQNEGRSGYQNTDQGGWQNESRSTWQNENRSSAQGNDACNGRNYYHDRYRGTQQDRYNGWQQDGQRSSRGVHSSGKSGKGPRIAIAVVLAVVFVAACVGISWFAVNNFQTQLSASNEVISEQEEAAAVTEENAAEEQTAEADAAQNESQISKAGTIQESGKVTAVVTDVTDVVDKVMPACVSITNESTLQYQDFWGQTYSQDSQSNGSGIIIGQNDTELLVVTNNHVVEEADTLYVQFIDGESTQALVKGTDSTVDLAVLAVSLADISAETREEICIAQMGDSDSLKIGEPAIAIGNALGYGQSVTTGVISALNRTLEVSETGSSNALIQTDAAINPGNSGGALLNINGEVIGINSSKIGDSLVEGMGYAIPISTAKPIIEDLMNKETKVRVAEEEKGYLGISCINVTSDLSQNFNMPEGVFVAQVYEGTGADKAGLVRGDIITAFDGTTVKNQAELTALTQYYKAGETVEITIMQGSPTGYQAKNVELTLSSVDEMNAGAEEEQQENNMPGYFRP